MKKIITIFDRDWDGDRGVTDKYADDRFPDMCTNLVAFEKVDGTNVRLTVRNHILVRLEKRKNPDKLQKQKRIVDPWYVDADELDPQDKHIWLAANSTDLTDLEDGEWSGEAIGPKIQGNPLGLKFPFVVIFSNLLWRNMLAKHDVPTDFDGLKDWLPKEKSNINPDAFIEGIVWYIFDSPCYKIKTKDFK